MRDPEQMIELLRKMSDDPAGGIMSVEVFDMSSEDMAERHNLELLVDIGHAIWIGPERHRARITNDGYDFLHAVDVDQDIHDRFIELFNRGVPYLRAALDVLKLVGNGSQG